MKFLRHVNSAGVASSSTTCVVRPNSVWRRICVLSLGFFCVGIVGRLSCTAADIARYRFHDIEINVCKIDLRHDTLRMFWRDDHKQVFGKFNRLQAWLRPQGEDVVCATNGGIYDIDYRPRGLYIENGVTLRRLNRAKGGYGNFYLQQNGIFLIGEQGAEIVETDRFAAERAARWPHIVFATQSGPLLIQNGQINPAFATESHNKLIRNAACTTSPHDVVLAFARGPVSFFEFATFLHDTLGCHDALYLDGHISRMYPGDDADVGTDFGVLVAAVRKAGPSCQIKRVESRENEENPCN